MASNDADKASAQLWSDFLKAINDQRERQNGWGTLVFPFQRLQAGRCSNFNKQSCLPSEHLFHQSRPSWHQPDDLVPAAGAGKYLIGHWPTCIMSFRSPWVGTMNICTAFANETATVGDIPLCQDRCRLFLESCE